MSVPKILIVTTQPWLQVVRLALRLTRYGADVKAICPSGSPLSYADWISAAYPFWTWNPLASLRSAIEKSNPDYLIPADDRAVWFLHELAEIYPHLETLIRRSIGPAHSYTTVRSRTKLLSLAKSLGITVPATCRVDNRADLEACVTTMPLPFFIKKDGTWGGGGVHAVADLEEARSCYRSLLESPGMAAKVKQRIQGSDRTVFAKLSCTGVPEISVQARVEGVAANAMFACHEGRILGSAQVRVISAKGKQGAALMIELIKDERIEKAGALLAASLELSGFFGLDFILAAETGEPYLIEMNPRCTQLGHIEVADQPDLAGMLWARWSGSENPKAGSAALSTSISFFPHAQQWAPESPFLNRSRMDVCAEDFEAVACLDRGNPSRSAGLRRRVRQQMGRLRLGLQAVCIEEIFYFDELDASEAHAATFAAVSRLHAERSTATERSEVGAGHNRVPKRGQSALAFRPQSG